MTASKGWITYSGTRYTVSATGPAGAGTTVPINMILNVEAIGGPEPLVDRVFVPGITHWVYAEIAPANATAPPPQPGTGTYIVGSYQAGVWNWAHRVDTPNGIDQAFIGVTPGFALNNSILTSAGVVTGTDVVIYTAVGWDTPMPPDLAALLATPNVGAGFPAAPPP